jgi:hypothetical protein
MRMLEVQVEDCCDKTLVRAENRAGGYLKEAA